jgi:hypothetical protein
MANISNEVNVHDGAAVTNWISQINAGGTVYDIATHHNITFVEGQGGARTTWNGLSDIEVVIPTIKDIVQTPIEFAGTVGADGVIVWNADHTDGPKTGYLVFVTADCTFDGKACEAGDMAIYAGDGENEGWKIVSGENQVQLVGSTDADNRLTIAVGASKDVLTVEGKTLALTLDYADLNGHVTVTPTKGEVISVDMGDVTVAAVNLKLEGSAETKSIGKDTDFKNATALEDGTVGFNVSKVVTSVDFGTFNAGAFPEAKRNTAKDFAVTGGSLTAGAGSDFVTDVTLGEIKLVEAGAGDADKITVLSGIKSGVGASFLNGIALTKDGETADLTIAGAYIPENGVGTTFVDGLKDGKTSVLTGFTEGSFNLTSGATEIVTGFDGSDEVIDTVTATVNNDTDVLASASVTDHVLSFAPAKVASSVEVKTTKRNLQLTKTGFNFQSAKATSSELSTSGFTQAEDINYTFGRANETVYTPEHSMWKVSVDAPTVDKGAYTINRNDMKVTVGAGVFVEDVTGGTLPSWTGGVAQDMTLEGSVGTALSTEDITIKELTVDAIDLPKYSLKSVDKDGDVVVGASGVAAVADSTVDLEGYLKGVAVTIA